MGKKVFKIRPYARLLTMLGEQLIKNEQIALTELIKNSYDADADWVKVSFENFGDNFEINENSKIIIRDNGIGMSLETIKKSWMNPATPNKHSKKGEVKKTKHKKRIIQGEKGIGRFAILKLGNKILITTRPEGTQEEYKINYDLSAYDKDFLTENNQEKELFIDDINIEVSINKNPDTILNQELEVEHNKVNQKNHGTVIEISGLKGKWNRKKIENIYKDIQKLQPIFDRLENKESKGDFTVGFYINNEILSLSDDYLDKLSGLLETKAVFKITEGEFNNNENKFYFKENSIPKLLDLNDSELKGLKIFKEHFCIKELDKEKNKEIYTDKYRMPECGNFSFKFFIFDFGKNAPLKYQLDRSDRELIREHRIYLYRDDIRVYPYGNKDDDWLQIDKLRGLERASYFFSNDQIIGVVKISKKDNPELKDKTNREGLIDEGNATQDFITLIQSFLSYYRQKQFKQYLIDYQKNKKEQDIFKTNEIERQLEYIKENFKDNKVVLNAVNNLSKTYKLERNYLVKRVESTEDLASIGLSVEVASHDMMSMISKGLINIDDLIKDLSGGTKSTEETIDELHKIRGIISFVESQMKEIQVMFKSTKQRRRNIRVADILEKVIRIYKNVLRRAKIKVDINKIGSPLIAKCTDAILLQLFINLFDNAIYWLGTTNIKNKSILITLDGTEGKLIFSDNGPGVNKDDIPYIFEPFYSGKGEEGRGLGLYIARQLLERIDYSIWLAEIDSERLLSGANFIVSFVKED